jgi:protein-S-isoprenylcysteine O-methyltransferase Ste14
MVKMTPEREAAYALDFGVARSDLPEKAQLAYDRLAQQRARAKAQAPAPAASTDDQPLTVPKRAAAVITALAILFGPGPGILVVLLPYLITNWHPGAAYPLAVRILGLALIAAGGILMTLTLLRFPAEGSGTPLPTNPPSSQKVLTGGPYRYVRNPLYVSYVPAIAGQALLLSRPVLLTYTAALLAFLTAFVRLYEEPTLTKRYGTQYQAYRKQVPGWLPRLPRRTLRPLPH